MTATRQQQLKRISRIVPKWNDAYQYAELMTNPSINMTVYRFTDNPSGDNAFITRAEWYMERDKMQKQQDNSWHERGEFPPVGCECEIMHKCWIDPNEVKIAAITKEYVIVVDCQREQHYHLRDITFRPLRTEREKAIDEMDAALRNRGSAISDVILGELYDAGFRMVKP